MYETLLRQYLSGGRNKFPHLPLVCDRLMQMDVRTHCRLSGVTIELQIAVGGLNRYISARRCILDDPLLRSLVRGRVLLDIGPDFCTGIFCLKRFLRIIIDKSVDPITCFLNIESLCETAVLRQEFSVRILCSDTSCNTDAHLFIER